MTISMLYIVDVTLTDRDRWFWFTCSAVSGQEHCLHQRDTVKNKLRRVKKYRVMTNEYEVLSFVCLAFFLSFLPFPHLFIGFVDEKEKDRIILYPERDKKSRQNSGRGSEAVCLNY